MLAVTGATGFVGRTLCASLAREGRPFRAIGRAVGPGLIGVGDLGPDTAWDSALDAVSTVIHLAARVHHMRESEADPLRAYRQTNVDGTLHLARRAHACGVKRLVFVSSIKVNGERTQPGRPFRPEHPAAPLDPYGRSKGEAEQALRAFAAETGFEVVIVRPPLVYGPDVGANFRALVSLVRRGLPLPLGSIRNKRSLIAVENLVDLLFRCADHPGASGGTFLCRDGQDLSTPMLVRLIGRALDTPVRLLPAPVWALRGLAGLVGQGAAVQRLSESLEVDDSATRDRLDWLPPFDVETAFTRSASGWSAQVQPTSIPGTPV